MIRLHPHIYDLAEGSLGDLWDTNKPRGVQHHSAKWLGWKNPLRKEAEPIYRPKFLEKEGNEKR